MRTPTGIVTCLPDVDVDDLVGIIEVLVQESLPTFAVPAAKLAELRRIFGQRASFGAWEVVDEGSLRTACDDGAEFVFCDVSSQMMVGIARDRGLPMYVSAMTPSEVRRVLALDVAGALLWPADVVGHGMAQHLDRVGLLDRVIPMGGVGAFAAGEWLKHGAPAAAIGGNLLGDAPSGGDLGQLRDRCASFRKAAERGQQPQD